MKLDRQKLEQLAALDDVALWREVRRMVGEKGIRLGETVPNHEDMVRLREAFLGGSPLSMVDGARLISEYKRKYRR
jgi:hypothetical protein